MRMNRGVKSHFLEHISGNNSCEIMETLLNSNLELVKKHLPLVLYVEFYSV